MADGSVAANLSRILRRSESNAQFPRQQSGRCPNNKCHRCSSDTTCAIVYTCLYIYMSVCASFLKNDRHGRIAGVEFTMTQTTAAFDIKTTPILMILLYYDTAMIMALMTLHGGENDNQSCQNLDFSSGLRRLSSFSSVKMANESLLNQRSLSPSKTCRQ
jgi:hypothetical protein